MACTKIFSGDLPEITSEIIQYFRNDFSTLHSCILVNRLWCRLAIPLLWENPFSLEYPKNYRYIEVYLQNLNDDDKTQLNEYGISNDLLSSNVLFDYLSFIKHLDIHKISDTIEKWVSTIISFSNYSTQMYYKKLVYRLLFRRFIENKVDVHTFRVAMVSNKDYEYFNDTTELVIQNPNFTYNIRNLTLYFERLLNENIISKFMIFLYSNCNSILSLDFTFSPFDNQTIEKHLSQLINSQQNLKKVTFSFNDNLPLYHSLLSFKNSNCTNTLRTVTFYCINFNNVVVFNEVFEQLNVLESIHIIYCSLNSNFTQQIINLTKPFKLKSLFMSEPLPELQSLLQKSDEYLENVVLEIGLTQEELELYIKYCSSKIKFLKLSSLYKMNIYKTFHLIKKYEHNLNYLIIESYNDIQSSTVLQNLGQILPSKLEFLSLVLKIFKTSDFEIFFKNLQNTFIKKLLIENTSFRERDELESKIILSYMKEYIMKKKRTRYLAFLDCFYTQGRTKDDDLASLKNELEEFRLHNIIVKNYHDLNTEVHNFIIKMY
jgi:hypothetical protein